MDYVDYEPVLACDLCGGRSFKAVNKPAAIVECAACGFRFVTPRPTQAEIAQAYSRADQYDSWLADDASRLAMWERRWRQVQRVRPAPGRLLDVGAGLGTFASLASRDGWKVDGTEVSRRAQELARERYGIELRLGQLEDIDFPEARYDLITLWHVIEHVPSPTAAVAICRKLLDPDGLLIMAMPNDGAAAHLLTIPGRLVHRALGRKPTRYQPLKPGGESHVSHFTPGTIRRLLVQGGFTVVAVGVDDARPVRSPIGAALFRARKGLTALTPWNFGLEMFVVARPKPGSKAGRSGA